MSGGEITVAVAIAAVVGLLASVVAVGLTRRGVRERLTRSLMALDRRPVAGDGGPRGIEAVLDRLERAVEGAHRQAQDARLSADRLALALTVIPQGVVVWDESGNEILRNEAAHAFDGARHGEALVEQAIGQLLREALAGRADRRTVDLFGPPRRTLVISAAPLRDGERITGAVAVVDDVSERRRLDAVRRDFVANISHELRTPVGALGLLAETLAAEEDPNVARRLAGRMQDEATRVGRIIEDLLDLSMIEAEEAPRREPVPVDVVVADAVERVKPAAEARGIRIAVGDGEERTIRGDRRQLVSALFNLLDNAIKYSGESSCVEVRSRAEHGWVEVEVQDHGIGIPHRDLERIFERFYRVDRARSRETGGTGLGLAIVRHVAMNHRGEVRVASREGEGSTFTLRLPAEGGPVVNDREHAEAS